MAKLGGDGARGESRGCASRSPVSRARCSVERLAGLARRFAQVDVFTTAPYLGNPRRAASRAAAT
jgi:hypothetical protein